MKTNQHTEDGALRVEAGTAQSLTLEAGAPAELQVAVEPDARLDLLVLHDTPGSFRHSVALQRNSVLNLFYLTLAGADVSQHTHVDLLGENAECNIFCLTAAAQEQRCLAALTVNHAVPGCRSVQLVKQIAAGSSSVDFGGRVVVAKDAQRTDARQACHTLLLSEAAHARAQPRLEIYADDVKCSHGATVGQLDRESLFYLRSRGVGLAEAQQLLLLGFADEVVQKIPAAALRERAGRLVAQRLAEML